MFKLVLFNYTAYFACDTALNKDLSTMGTFFHYSFSSEFIVGSFSCSHSVWSVLNVIYCGKLEHMRLFEILRVTQINVI